MKPPDNRFIGWSLFGLPVDPSAAAQPTQQGRAPSPGSAATALLILVAVAVVALAVLVFVVVSLATQR